MTPSYTIKDLENILEVFPHLAWFEDSTGKIKYTNRDTEEQEIVELIRVLDDMQGQTQRTCLKELPENKFISVYQKYVEKEGKLIGRCGISRDVTLQHQISNLFQDSCKELLQLFDVMDLPTIDLIFRQTFRQYGKKVLDKMQGQGMAVFLFDHTRTNINIEYLEGFTEEGKERLLEISKSLDYLKYKQEANTAAKMRSIKEISNIEHRNILSSQGIKYMVSYPIPFGKEIIGMLKIYYTHDTTLIYKHEVFMNIVCIYIGLLLKDILVSQTLLEEVENVLIARKELDIFFQEIDDLLCVIKPGGRIIALGKGWKNILHWKKEELKEKKIFSFIHPEDAPLFEKIYSYSDKDADSIKKLRLRTKEGGYKNIEWKMRYILHEDLIIAVGRDITEGEKKAAEYIMLQKKMQQESLKGEFLLNTSNEFKTPINVVIAAIQLLEDYIVTQSLPMQLNLGKYVAIIKQNAYRLLKLINNLIDINTIEYGQYSLNLDTYNIIQIIREVVLSIEEYVRTKDITLLFETQVDEAFTLCDPELIERVILNLISNAIKYTSENGHIKVSIKQKEKVLCISIEDNGEGIKQEKLTTIFERFVQGDDPLTRKREGSGIGLSLTKSIIEMHHGSIGVESEVGKGTKFTICLPIVDKMQKTNIHTQTRSAQKRTETWSIEFSDIYK